MTQPLNKIKQAAQSIRLSHDEKALMRARVLPDAPSLRPQRSPYTIHWISMRMSSVVALLLIVVMGSGTVYAAKGSLPGDPLYTLKISVAEPLEGALAVSPQAKANFQASIVEERMQEAETLASQGRLTTSTTDSLEENLSQHAKVVEDIAQGLEDSDPEVAAEVHARIDSALLAHGVILRQLGSESEDNDSKENSFLLATQVSTRARDNHGAQVVALRATAPVADTASFKGSSTSASTTKAIPASSTSNAVQMHVAVGLEKQARRAIANARNLFASISGTAGTSTNAEVLRRLDAADTLMQKKDYTEALKQAVQLAVYLKAGKKFDGKLLTSLFGNAGLGGSEDIGTSSGKGDQNNNNDHKGTSTIEVPEVQVPDINVHIDD
jgi:hypothetical protein